MTARLLKVTGPSGEPLHGGSGSWPLPRKAKSGRWLPGRWRRVKDQVLACVNGLHLTDDEHITAWLPKKGGYVVWLAEGRGDSHSDRDDKVAFREARLLRPLLTVTEEAAVAFRRATGRNWPSSIDEMTKFLATYGLPTFGESPVFGVHRLAEPYAPAWPTAAAVKRQRFQRMIATSRSLLGIPRSLDALVQSEQPGAYDIAASWRPS